MIGSDKASVRTAFFKAITASECAPLELEANTMPGLSSNLILESNCTTCIFLQKKKYSLYFQTFNLPLTNNMNKLTLCDNSETMLHFVSKSMACGSTVLNAQGVPEFSPQLLIK
jgi:hypothetical protein